jgi:hypothetical protein
MLIAGTLEYRGILKILLMELESVYPDAVFLGFDMVLVN